MQLWFYLTPVFYSSSAVIPERYRPLYFLNPMSGIVEGFRWALTGEGAVDFASFAVSLLAAGVVLVGGLYFFRRMERLFADWV